MCDPLTTAFWLPRATCLEAASITINAHKGLPTMLIRKELAREVVLCGRPSNSLSG